MFSTSVLRYPPVAALHVWVFALGTVTGLVLPALASILALETAARFRLRK